MPPSLLSIFSSFFPRHMENVQLLMRNVFLERVFSGTHDVIPTPNFACKIIVWKWNHKSPLNMMSSWVLQRKFSSIFLYWKKKKKGKEPLNFRCWEAKKIGGMFLFVCFLANIHPERQILVLGWVHWVSIFPSVSRTSWGCCIGKSYDWKKTQG